jgi:hypothetical protein
MWAILTSKLGLAGIALLLVAGVFGVQRLEIATRDHTIAAMKATQVAAKADVATHEAKAAQISTSAGTQLQATHTAISAHYAPLIARVKTDVSDQDDHDCRVPDGWSRLWLAGEAGADPGLSAAADLRHQSPAAEAGHAPR